MAVIQANEATFKNEVLNAQGTVLVDFWADWCGPCRMLSPMVDRVASRVENAKVVKVNVDDNMALAQQYGIVNIPCLIVFKDGKEVNRSVGVIPEKSIEELLKA
jgi:thioredoxin 1